jgi:hypothetical protein
MTRRLTFLWFALALLAAGPALAQTEFPLSLSAPAFGDSYGNSVDIDGDRLVVGVPGDDRAGVGVGAAVIYERTGAGWVETATLFPPVDPNGVGAGYSVAISGDRVLVGAPLLGNYTGAAYVYDLVGTAWTLTATLTPTDPGPGKGIGWSLDLDGDRAVVAAPGDATGGFNAGAAYVFDFVNSTWTQTAKLTAAAPAANDVLSYSLGLDGDRVVAGAPGSALEDGNGAAHVFEKTLSGWAETVLTASDGASGDSFGTAVAVSGPRVVVGAWRKSVVAARDGRAYVFEQTGTAWAEQAQLDGTTTHAYRGLGYAVAIEGDRIVVGAPSSPTETAPGTALVYDRSGATWSLTDRLEAQTGQQGALFGGAVAVGGARVAVGAFAHDILSSDEGKAYVFELTDAAPLLLLAADGITVGRASALVGDVHSNAGLTLSAQGNGYAGSYTSDLTAVGAILVDRRNEVDGDVTAGGTLTVHPTATVTGTAAGSASVASVALPTVAAFAPGTQNVTVQTGQTQALAPGAYRRVRVRDGATLVLTAGTYALEQLLLNGQASVQYDVAGGPITVRTTRLTVGSDAAMAVTDGPTAAPELSDRVTVETTQTTDLSLGARSVVVGTLTAPAALVRLRADVAFTGALAAREIVAANGTTLLAHGASAPPSLAARPAAAVAPDTTAALGLSAAPNPFSGRATLTVTLAEAGTVRLTVYDLLGREVRVLADGPLAAGAHRVALDGAGLPAGVYLVRLATPQGVAAERVTLVR